MNTHPIQFGKRSSPTGQAHSRSSQMDRKFFQPVKSDAGDRRHADLVKNTEKWVAQTFYGEMLKQMRNSPFKSKMFDGGEAGQTFNQMHDAQLAEHMAKGAGKKLVDAIVHKVEAQRAYAGPAAAPKHKLHPAELTPAMRARMGVNA